MECSFPNFSLLYSVRSRDSNEKAAGVLFFRMMAISAVPVTVISRDQKIFTGGITKNDKICKNRRGNEQMFAAVWTNEGQYGIINSDSFHNFDVHTGKSLNGFFKLSAEVYNFRMVQKIGFSNQNSSKSHFLENGICASTNFWRIVELFDYRIWRWYLCKLHKIYSNFTVNTSQQATSRRQSKPS